MRYAAGGIKLDGLEGFEKRPAQAKPILHRVIEVFRRNKTFADQAERFGEQRALQPVQDKAVDLAVYRDRHLPDLRIDFARTVDCVRRGPGRAAKLDQRYEMRWIDGMADQTPSAAGQHFREARCRDGRGRRHQQSIGRGEFVELGKDRNLLVDNLRAVLLHELDTLDGLLQTRRDREPRRRAIRIVRQPMTRQRLQFFADQAGRRLQRRLMRIGKPRVPSGAGENRGTGASDQSDADDGYVSILLFHFLLTARALFGADRDRPAMPWTVPRESPGRAPAPPWCRTRPAPDRGCDRR